MTSNMVKPRKTETMYCYVCECVHVATMYWYVSVCCATSAIMYQCIYMCACCNQSCTSVCDCVHPEILCQCILLHVPWIYMAKEKSLPYVPYIFMHAWKHLPLTMHIIRTHLCYNTFTPHS